MHLIYKSNIKRVTGFVVVRILADPLNSTEIPLARD